MDTEQLHQPQNSVHSHTAPTQPRQLSLWFVFCRGNPAAGGTWRPAARRADRACAAPSPRVLSAAWGSAWRRLCRRSVFGLFPGWDGCWVELFVHLRCRFLCEHKLLFLSGTYPEVQLLSHVGSVCPTLQENTTGRPFAVRSCESGMSACCSAFLRAPSIFRALHFSHPGMNEKPFLVAVICISLVADGSLFPIHIPCLVTHLFKSFPGL